MSDALIVRGDDEATGYRFSWGLALAGAAVAVAVTFFLLVLGSGVGLLLLRPDSSAAHFFTGGAIYFVASLAFGFALGGHVAGRLLGPLPEETRYQEEVRAALHGLVVWAVSVLATLGLVAVAGAATGALYGVSRTVAPTARDDAPMRTTQLAVDRLFRPGGIAGTDNSTAVPAAATDPVHARAEAGRLIEAEFTPAPQVEARTDAGDRERLIQLTAEQAHVSASEAGLRVAALEGRLAGERRESALLAKRAASATALWLAFGLLFGAAVCMVAAVTARLEDDHETAWSLFAFHRGWRN